MITVCHPTVTLMKPWPRCRLNKSNEGGISTPQTYVTLPSSISGGLTLDQLTTSLIAAPITCLTWTVLLNYCKNTQDDSLDTFDINCKCRVLWPPSNMWGVEVIEMLSRYSVRHPVGDQSSERYGCLPLITQPSTSTLPLKWMVHHQTRWWRKKNVTSQCRTRPPLSFINIYQSI